MSAGKHIVYHVGKEVMKSAGGCMVTLVALLTGVGTLCTLIGIVFFA